MLLNHPLTTRKFWGNLDAVKQFDFFFSKGWRNFIIKGPKGVGKSSLVYFFVKKFLDPVLVEKGTHPELLVLENDTGIKEIREAINFLSYASDKPKVLLIDTELNNQSANCLLKISEAAHPQNLIFIIEQSFLPQTLLSRFWEVRLNYVKDYELIDLKLTPDELAIADGALGQIYWLAELNGNFGWGWLEFLTTLKENKNLTDWFKDLDNKQMAKFLELTKITCHKLVNKGFLELIETEKLLSNIGDFQDKKQLAIWATAKIILLLKKSLD